jgi:hypothetical protein
VSTWSRVAVIWPKNMLHDAGMAGLAKLRRSIRSTDERKLRAVHVGRGEIVWQDRCDAANGSKEPTADMSRLPIVQMQQKGRQTRPGKDAALQLEKRPFVVAALNFDEPMTELLTRRNFDG